MPKPTEQQAELRQIAIIMLSGMINADPIADYKDQRYIEAIKIAKEFQEKLNKEFGII